MAQSILGAAASSARKSKAPTTYTVAQINGADAPVVALTVGEKTSDCQLVKREPDQLPHLRVTPRDGKGKVQYDRADRLAHYFQNA